MTTTTTPPTDLRQQPGVCPECKGSCRTGSGYLREDCPACNGTGQQPAQPASGEVARKEFEAWVQRRHGCPIDKWKDTGNYQYDNTRMWWESWQAALELSGFDRLQSALAEAQEIIDTRTHNAIVLSESYMACKDGYDYISKCLTAAQKENADIDAAFDAFRELAREQQEYERAQLTAAQQRIAALHAALRTYGWHKPECDYMQEELPCTCGFMDAVKEQGNG